MDRHLGKAIDIISVFVEERVEERQQMKQGISSEQRKDFLDVLLDYRGTGKDELPKLSHHQVTIFLMEMFIAGTDTVSTTLEWVMAELLQNPQVMVKVKAELARVIGTNKKLQENDIDNLPYLRATIEESLRLHPPAPILLPRRANKDISFMGYSIPKNTQVLVNNWAFARDEECWEDALSFKPERFLDSNVNYKGQNFEFIPFGSGRRMCPGLPLAHRMAPFILGSLFHHFEWELCEGQKTIDMRETIGATSKKLEPLKAIPKRMMTT